MYSQNDLLSAIKSYVTEKVNAKNTLMEEENGSKFIEIVDETIAYLNDKIAEIYSAKEKVDLTSGEEKIKFLDYKVETFVVPKEEMKTHEIKPQDTVSTLSANVFLTEAGLKYLKPFIRLPLSFMNCKSVFAPDSMYPETYVYDSNKMSVNVMFDLDMAANQQLAGIPILSCEIYELSNINKEEYLKSFDLYADLLVNHTDVAYSELLLLASFMKDQIRQVEESKRQAQNKILTKENVPNFNDIKNALNANKQ